MTLIIGSGRTATHFKHYFQLMKVPFQSWDRKNNSLTDLENSLEVKLKNASQVWVLITDSNLQSFIQNELAGFSGPILHSSGALEISGAISLHPLMTFGPDLEPLSFYQEIPFVLTESKKIQDFFPQIKNKSFTIKAADKAKYHALCVLSGNFTTLLWQTAFAGFKNLGLPSSVAQPYLMKIAENLLNNPGAALTGPLARKDHNTVTKNLSALDGDPLQDIYRIFVKNYFSEYIP